MGAGKKMKNAAKNLKGKGKEAAGDATRDAKTEKSGRRDQAKANLKQAGEKVKDAFKH
jgi:uncharacterized protein YjbJ (UPF0337 family)